jgi:hypothetical protein
MKKIILFLILGIGIIFIANINSAYAMGSDQSYNPNLPNYVPPPATPPSKTSGTPTTTTTPAAKGVKNNPNDFLKQFSMLDQVQNAISTAGPAISQNLANISGQLFAYLAVISLILWSIQNLMFGDKGIKEFFLYFFFLMVVRGLLAAYNFFFVQGVANFFAKLGQTATGSQGSPMAEFGTVVQQVYMDIGNIMSGGKGGWLGFLWTLKSAVSMTGITVVLDQILLLVIACVVFGTIILIQVYVAIALITGYIFVPFMIFKPLEFLWNGWLKFLITSCLSYFLMYIIIGLMGGVLNAIASSAGYTGGSIVNNVAGTVMSVVVSPSNPASILGFLFVLAIFAYLFLKIPAIAGEIVSGMPNMSFSGVTSVVIGAASVMLAGGRIAGMAVKTGAQVMNKAKGNKE